MNELIQSTLSAILRSTAEGNSKLLDLSRETLGFPLSVIAMKKLIELSRLFDLRRVTYLILRGQPLSRETIPLVGVLLDGLSGVEQLSLLGCTIGDAGLPRILKALERHSRIVELDLGDNGITERGLLEWRKRPEVLSKLTRLCLDSNPLGNAGAAELARLSSQLLTLEGLELARCQIQYEGFHSLLHAVVHGPWGESLQRIFIRHNPLPEVPEEITEYNYVAHWYDYAFCLADPLRTLNCATILILGQGGVGKTHFRKRLFERDTYYYKPNEASTYDCDVVVYETRMPILYRDESLPVLIRDFGGQPELHSAHRLFLADRRGLFIVVCDATRTRSENRLDYWLGMIKHEASPHSPIFVVVTKCDGFDDMGVQRIGRRLERLDATELRKSFRIPPNTTLEVYDGVGCSSCEAMEGMAQMDHYTATEILENQVALALQNIPELQTAYAPQVRDVLDWLKSEGFRGRDGKLLPYLELAVLRRKCDELDLSNDDIKSVIHNAHSIGVIHFAGVRAVLRDGEDLAQLLFNPEWVRRPIYRLIRDAMHKCANGQISWKQVEHILPVHEGSPQAESLWEQLPFSASDRVRIMDLLVACEVIFEVHRGQEEKAYLIPDHLPARSVGHAPNGDFVWRRVFDWLSEAAFGRILGRLHRQASRGPGTIWRDEITVNLEHGPEVTVRMISGLPPGERSGSSGAESATTVYVAVSSCQFREAVRILNLLDAEFRSVVAEPLIGPEQWQTVPKVADPLIGAAAEIQVSDDAKLLLRALVEVRQSTRGSQRHAWRSKSEWFTRADMSRRGKDSEDLIHELLDLGLVESKSQGARGGWTKYRSTVAGAEFLASPPNS